MDQDTLKEGAKKIQKGEFSLDDFLKQLKQIQKLGSHVRHFKHDSGNGEI